MRKPLNVPIRVEPAASPEPSSPATAQSAATDLVSRLNALSKPMQGWTEADVRDQFALADSDRLVKTTISLCPDCLVHVPAAVVIRAPQVWLIKRCIEHGRSSALIENDERFYRVSNKDRWGRIYGQIPGFDIPEFGASCCGPGQSCGTPGETGPAFDGTDQSRNKTCTVLVEITDACNLACRVCYSDSAGDRLLDFAMFKQHIIELARRKGRLDSVQVTGGEASLHPRYFDMVDWLCAQNDAIGKIYLPTNGLLFNKPGYIDRLKVHRDRVLVLLQFDGRDDTSNPALRGAKPQRQREALIERLDRAGIAMQLTMTLSQDVSEADISWVVQQGLKHANVRLIAMQPAFYSGRYQLPPDPNRRLTLSDCAKGVVAGLGGRATLEDFLPIPCSHPNCGWVTLFARRFGVVRNIARHVDLNAVMNEVAYKTLLSQREMQDIVGTRGRFWHRWLARLGRKLIRPRDVFGIAIKPFMDRFSYDQDRISNCCHHILDTHGQAWSFCEYNARQRHQDSWASRPRLDEQPASGPCQP